MGYERTHCIWCTRQLFNHGPSRRHEAYRSSDRQDQGRFARQERYAMHAAPKYRGPPMVFHQFSCIPTNIETNIIICNRFVGGGKHSIVIKTHTHTYACVSHPHLGSRARFIVGDQVSKLCTARALYMARSSVPKLFPIARERERLNAAP